MMKDIVIRSVRDRDRYHVQYSAADKIEKAVVLLHPDARPWLEPAPGDRVHVQPDGALRFSRITPFRCSLGYIFYGEPA